MEKHCCPIVVVPTQIGDSSTRFYLATEEIDVSVPGSFVSEWLKNCNGEKTVGQVVELLSKEWNRVAVENFLAYLEQRKVICASTSVASHLWSYVKNPTIFPH